MPKSLLGFYHVQTFSMMYLPDFGMNSGEGSAKSLIGYLILMKVLSILCDASPLLTSILAGISSILSVILAYILLFRVGDGDKKIKIIVSFLYPIILIASAPSSILVGYVSGFSLILYFVILFFFITKRREHNYKSFFLMALITWITLGLFWHTVHIMTYIIIMTYVILSNIHKICIGKNNRQWNILILFTVLFIFMWFNLRESIIENMLLTTNSPITMASFFNRGSFINNYSYEQDLYIYAELISILRYFGYILAYIIVVIFGIKFSINIIRKKDVSNIHIFLIALLISDMLFMLMYFRSTGSFGPRILITFIYPIVIIMLNSKMKNNRNWLRHISSRRIITLFLIIPLIFTGTFSVYNYILESPEQNIPIKAYQNNFEWVVKYTHSDTIISDSHTSGHYQLLHRFQRIYETKPMDFTDVKYNKYEEIMHHTYSPAEASLLVINEILYDKHLVFRSLDAWNTFEPLSPEYVDENRNLYRIYNDGRMVIFY